MSYEICFPYPLSDYEKSLFTGPQDCTDEQWIKYRGQRYMSTIGDMYIVLHVSGNNEQGNLHVGDYVGIYDPLDDSETAYELDPQGFSARLIYDIPDIPADNDRLVVARGSLAAAQPIPPSPTPVPTYPIMKLTEEDVTADWVEIGAMNQYLCDQVGYLGYFANKNSTAYTFGCEWYQFTRLEGGSLGKPFNPGDFLTISRYGTDQLHNSYMVERIIPQAQYNGKDFYNCIAENKCAGGAMKIWVGWSRMNTFSIMPNVPFARTSIG